MDTHVKTLMVIGDKIIAEEIQRILEEEGIYVLLKSDNPASSFLNTAVGTGTIENVSIQLNEDDYVKAVEIINNSSYSNLLQ